MWKELQLAAWTWDVQNLYLQDEDPGHLYQLPVAFLYQQMFLHWDKGSDQFALEAHQELRYPMGITSTYLVKIINSSSSLITKKALWLEV